MKTPLALVFILIFSAGQPKLAHTDAQLGSQPVPEHKSLYQTLFEAFLPGLHRPSEEPFNYFASADQPNGFQAPFKKGRTRMYVTDENSPFVVDPHTPQGNLFELRF